MSVLILGGDNINPIKAVLNALGASKIKHWDARKNSICKKSLPLNIDCLVILTNFLNHNTMYKFKKEAKKRNIPFVCANRNESSVHEKFSKMFNIKNEIYKEGVMGIEIYAKDDLIKQDGCTC